MYKKQLRNYIYTYISYIASLLTHMQTIYTYKQRAQNPVSPKVIVKKGGIKHLGGNSVPKFTLKLLYELL